MMVLVIVMLTNLFLLIGVNGGPEKVFSGVRGNNRIRDSMPKVKTLTYVIKLINNAT